MDEQLLIVQADDVASWSGEADIVIAGAGIAGICAAIEAREHGAEVILLERASDPGGTSALSAGQFYLGGGTAVQKACGIEDSPETLYNFLMAVSPAPDPDIIRAFSEGGAEHFDWLEAHGLRFERSFLAEKVVIAPGTQGLIYNGNEKVWPFRECAKPAPRGHKVAEAGDHGGKAMMETLRHALENLAVRPVCDTRVVALIIDADGAIVGVRARDRERTRDLRARRGVILATGAFNYNDEMVERYTPMIAQWVEERHGTVNDDGFGILAGAAAGGGLRNMDGACITSPFFPPGQLCSGIVVNKLGQRFVSEESYHARVAALVAEQPDMAAYLVLDAETFAQPLYQMQPLAGTWDTVQELEKALAIPEGALQSTLAEYNRNAERGKDPQLHKFSEWLRPLATPPYFAFDLSYGKATYVTGMTLGGLRISGDAEVLGESGRPVEGLYAAGACSANIAQHGLNYSSGMQLGHAGLFGRRAARAALRRTYIDKIFSLDPAKQR